MSGERRPFEERRHFRGDCEAWGVAAKTSVSGLGGAISHVLRRHEPVELHAVGASAVNQAVKAVAAAHHNLLSDDPPLHLWMAPEFLSGIAIEGTDKTIIRIRVEVDDRAPDPD